MSSTKATLSLSLSEGNTEADRLATQGRLSSPLCPKRIVIASNSLGWEQSPQRRRKVGVNFASSDFPVLSQAEAEVLLQPLEMIPMADTAVFSEFCGDSESVESDDWGCLSSCLAPTASTISGYFSSHSSLVFYFPLPPRTTPCETHDWQQGEAAE